MELIIDSREPASQMRRLKRLEVDYNIQTLPVGDYLFKEKGIIFERKTVEDLVASIRSGRLQRQLVNMQTYPYPYLIIIGSWKELFFRKVQISQGQIAGMLASLAVRYKAKIIQVENENQAIRVMLKIEEKTEDGKEMGLESFDFIRTYIRTEDIHLKMVCCIPGISMKKGKQILSKFSLKDLFGAEQKELESVEGIGKKLSEEIKKHLNNLKIEPKLSSPL